MSTVPPTGSSNGAQGAEYQALAQQLAGAISDAAARPMLAMLAQLYPDMAERLVQLRAAVEHHVGSEERERLAEELKESRRQKAAADAEAEKRALYGLPPVTEAATKEKAPKEAAKVSTTTPTEEASARARGNWRRGAVRPAWNARKRGNIAKEIYTGGGYGMFPRCVNAQVRAAMSKTVLLAYLVCCEEADYDGQYEMPAEQLGDRVGCNRRNAQNALYALLAGGLIRIVHAGGPRTPNVYGLTPFREFDEAKALSALEQHRAATTDRIRKGGLGSGAKVRVGVAHATS